MSAISGCASLLLFIFLTFFPYHLFLKAQAACRKVLVEKCLVYVRYKCTVYCLKLRGSICIFFWCYLAYIQDLYWSWLPSSFLCTATSIPHTNVPCCPLDYCSPYFTFFILHPSSSYLQNPQIILSQNDDTVGIKFKGSTLFTVAVVAEGGKKKCSELLTNMKHDVVDQPSHTTQMFPAEKDILVTAKF